MISLKITWKIKQTYYLLPLKKPIVSLYCSCWNWTNLRISCISNWWLIKWSVLLCICWNTDNVFQLHGELTWVGVEINKGLVGFDCGVAATMINNITLLEKNTYILNTHQIHTMNTCTSPRIKSHLFWMHINI